jgi:lipoyl(octanoyl) transferase
MTHSFVHRQLGFKAYEPVYAAMRDFTLTRDADTPDELWQVEHPSVYTQGQAGKPEHILNPGDIPIVQSDRGGQVTYHGPGQLVLYTLLDLKRLKIGIKQLVSNIEQSVIDTLAQIDIPAERRCGAPGIYANDAKICSLGLRIRHGKSYHGLAFNIDMDLEPFSRINPCGFQNLKITQVSDFIGPTSIETVVPLLIANMNKIGLTQNSQGLR